MHGKKNANNDMQLKCKGKKKEEKKTKTSLWSFLRFVALMPEIAIKISLQVGQGGGVLAYLVSQVIKSLFETSGLCVWVVVLSPFLCLFLSLFLWRREQPVCVDINPCANTVRKVGMVCMMGTDQP
jgi:hypothetical protein